MTPIKLTFKSSKIVFPLKISSIAQKQITDSNSPSQTGSTFSSNYTPEERYVLPSEIISIHLFIVSDHKVKAPTNFSVEYANWFKRQTVADLAQDSQGNAWYIPKARKVFITRLNSYMPLTEITSDLYFKPDGDNKPVNANYIDWWAHVLLFLITFLAIWLSPVGTVFIIAALVYYFTHTPTWKAIAVFCGNSFDGGSSLHFLVSWLDICPKSLYTLRKYPRSYLVNHSCRRFGTCFNDNLAYI